MEVMKLYKKKFHNSHILRDDEIDNDDYIAVIVIVDRLLL